MNPPLVSVILPNCNHEQFLEERLQSIFNQTFEDFEVIILDDASNDNSLIHLNKAAENPMVTHLVVNQINSGSPFKQWKKGIELATGKYIWIAESDDLSEPELLQKLVSQLEANDQLTLAYCDCTIITEEGRKIHDKNPWIHEVDPKKWTLSHTEKGIEFLRDFQRYRNILSNAGNVVFRRDALKEIEFISDQFTSCGDWLFWNQLCIKGDIYFEASALNHWRNHEDTTRSNTNIQKDIERMRENRTVIQFTNGKLIKEKFNSDKYDWLLRWWMSRYSYKNLFVKGYTFGPIPTFLKGKFYSRLFIRTFKELGRSIARIFVRKKQ